MLIPKTKVVNIYAQPFDAYIGNSYDERDPRQLKAGEFGFLGNPFTEGSTAENLIMFEEYFRERLETDKLFRRAVLSLYGKTLGCICDDSSCHGHIIAEWLDEHRGEYLEWFGTPKEVVSGS